MTDKPRLLDLFCGAGGAGMGYFHAGFEVVGIDIEPQKHYPFEFHQADALEYLQDHWQEFDAFHASPVCKQFTKLRFIHKREYPDFITPIRPLLVATGKPWVIENVPEAPLINPIILCGTMFPELRVYRHRAFETNPPLYFPPGQCNHWGTCSSDDRFAVRNGTPSLDKYDFLTIAGNDYKADDGRKAMGINWMIKKELSQAIPPVYTEWIGKQLIEFLDQQIKIECFSEVN